MITQNNFQTGAVAIFEIMPKIRNVCNRLPLININLTYIAFSLLTEVIFLIKATILFSWILIICKSTELSKRIKGMEFETAILKVSELES